MARILLGVTGGIAAYKAVELVRLATGAGHSSILRHVTAPLMWPGMLAVLVYYTLARLESFETPLALGISGGWQIVRQALAELRGAAIAASAPAE